MLLPWLRSIIWLHSLIHKRKQTAISFPFLFIPAFLLRALWSFSAPVLGSCPVLRQSSVFILSPSHGTLSGCLPCHPGKLTTVCFPSLTHPNNLDERIAGGDQENSACIKTSWVISCILAINLTPSHTSITPYQVGYRINPYPWKIVMEKKESFNDSLLK